MSGASREFPPPYISLAFGDGEYLFKLGLAQIAELQTKCGAGIGKIYARVLAGRYESGLADDPLRQTIGLPGQGEWFAGDLLETIRLALVGGGEGMVSGEAVKVSPTRAVQLVEAYVFPARPLDEAWTLAAAILTSLIVGYQPPEGAGADTKKKPQTRKGDSITRAP